MSNNPNVVVIMTDHQRADSIGMFQDNKEVTPRLNEFSKQASVFTRAYNACPLCVPARTAISTGKYPTKNGVVFNDVKGIRAKDNKTIHQYLNEFGYEVGHVGIQHVRVNPGLSERADFSKWIEEEDYKKYAADLGLNIKRAPEESTEVEELQDGVRVKKRYSNTVSSIWKYEEEQFKDNYFCRESIDFIKQKHEKPFALFVNFWAPHPPLVVPEPYASKFNPNNIELPKNIGEYAQNMPDNRKMSVPAQLAKDVSMEEWKKVWAAHLGLVNMVDSYIGRILDEIKNCGYDDNTIILFTTDHGDHLGQHSMYQKMEMYEQAVNIPFMIKGPNIQKNTINEPISHLDIVPTILDLVGMKLPNDLDGISLKNTLQEGKIESGRCVYGQYSGNPTIGDIRRMVVNKKYKYVYDPDDIPELYDLEEDPLEMNNIYNNDDVKEVVTDLHNCCKKWAEEHNDWVKL